jgi:hypothetical protein
VVVAESENLQDFCVVRQRFDSPVGREQAVGRVLEVLLEGDSTMKTATIVACAVLLLSATLVVLFHQPMFAQAGTTESEEREGHLNTVSLILTSAQLDPLEGNGVVRAFVSTGSKSLNCLASLNEIRTNVFPTGITLFCGEREPFAFGGVPGMLVSVFFTQPAPPDLAVSVTLYQQGAKKYGAPVLCTANDGC